MTSLFERFVFVSVASMSCQTVAAVSDFGIATLAGVTLLMFAIGACCIFIIVLMKECFRICCRNESDNNKPEPPGPAYDEINEELRLKALPPPSLPQRPPVPARPEDGEYIIPGRSDIYGSDHFYDEIDEVSALRHVSLPPPRLPMRPAKPVDELNVPAESAPALPEEPEYIIPEAPEELALASLKFSHPPLHPKIEDKRQQARQTKKVNSSPEETDYSLNPDGYLRPIK